MTTIQVDYEITSDPREDGRELPSAFDDKEVWEPRTVSIWKYFDGDIESEMLAKHAAEHFALQESTCAEKYVDVEKYDTSSFRYLVRVKGEIFAVEINVHLKVETSFSSVEKVLSPLKAGA